MKIHQYIMINIKLQVWFKKQNIYTCAFALLNCTKVRNAKLDLGQEQKNMWKRDTFDKTGAR